MNYQFPFDTLEEYMKRAGISTGYTEKPCLDPKDPLCPETAPNKLSQQVNKKNLNKLHSKKKNRGKIRKKIKLQTDIIM